MAQSADTPDAAEGERQAASLAALAAVLADIRAGTVAELGLAPGTAVLDAGCGVGELAISLAPRVEPGGRVVGIDLNPDAVDRAQAAGSSGGVRVDFRVADIRALPFERDEFDAVRSERVFQYLDPVEAAGAAAELVRVAKPGGIIQVVDPDHGQTAITATDREVGSLLLEQFTRLSKNPESGLYLGALLRAAGAEAVAVRLWPSTFTSLSAFLAVRDLRSELAYLVARRVADADRAAAFMADLVERDRDGGFLASMITYSATGQKA